MSKLQVEEEKKVVEAVAPPQSAYVLFIKDLRQKQKEGQGATGASSANFLSEASKQWASLDAAEKQRFQDEAQTQKHRYLEYKRVLKEMAPK